MKKPRPHSILCLPRNPTGPEKPIRFPVGDLDDAMREHQFLTSGPPMGFYYIVVEPGVDLAALLKKGLVESVVFMTSWLYDQPEMADLDIVVSICKPLGEDQTITWPYVSTIKESARKRYRHARRFFRAALRFKLYNRDTGDRVTLFNRGQSYVSATAAEEHDILYGNLDDEGNGPKWGSGFEVLGNWFQKQILVRTKHGELLRQEGEVQSDRVGPGGVQAPISGNSGYWLSMTPEQAAHVRPWIRDYLNRGGHYGPLLDWARQISGGLLDEELVEFLAADKDLLMEFHKRQTALARKGNYTPLLPEDALIVAAKTKELSGV